MALKFKYSQSTKSVISNANSNPAKHTTGYLTAKITDTVAIYSGGSVI